MTKTCVKCQGQFETEDLTKTMCPVCESAQATATAQPATEAPAATEQPAAEVVTPVTEAPVTGEQTKPQDNSQTA